MNKFFRNSFFAAALCGAAVLSSCSDDPSLPDNAVNFESTTLGFTNAESELTINIRLHALQSLMALSPSVFQARALLMEQNSQPILRQQTMVLLY
ncbi:MAG: hypothetical protein WDO15_23885 [Bacteroidota bacterium]